MSNLAKSTAFLATIGFRRDLTLRIQSTNLGSASLNPAIMPARYSDIPWPGDKVEFGELNIQFLLDEDINEWVVINEWMFEACHGEFVDNDELISNVEITVLDTQNRETVKILYHNAHPTSISDIDYSVVDDEGNLISTATFVYTHYTITNVKTGKVIEYGKSKSGLN